MLFLALFISISHFREREQAMTIGRAVAAGCRRAAAKGARSSPTTPATRSPHFAAFGKRSGSSSVTSLNRVAATTRSFATDSAASSDASYELLKKDFRKWLSKEAQILSLLLVVGTTGVYFYKVMRT